MSLAEIKGAVAELTPKELAELAALDWPEFPVFDGSPVDGALRHDKYIYDEQ